jgi:3-hydroxyisobutyrate dehydrogenase-like beta-hydroxyacid dehydrogenase
MITVGMIGVGAMGSRIARRLLGAGYEVVVWNRTMEKTQPLADAGAGRERTPAEMTRRSDVVITMVADPTALKAVTQGREGILAGADRDLILLEMSTVGPRAIAEAESLLPEGAGLLDAPVLGSLSEAESGALQIFVGGQATLFERWQPLLSELGSPLHVGPLGTGAAAKLLANSTLLGVLGVLGEALALANALGVPRDRAFEVLSKTPLAAQAEKRRPSIERGDYPPRFRLSLARKDADLIVDASAAAGTDLRLAAAVQTWMAEAEVAGLADADYSALLGYISSLQRRATEARDGSLGEQ